MSSHPMWSYPTEHALAPRVHEAKEQNEHEDPHLDEPEAGVAFELRRPREDEHGLDVEDDEQQREDVVPDLALRPTFADRIDATLVGRQLLRGRFVRPHECRDAEQRPRQNEGDGPEPDDREVVAQEVRHRVRRYYVL